MVREIIVNSITSFGIDIQEIRTLPNSEKSRYLINQLFTPTELERFNRQKAPTGNKKSNKGLVVVKPELADYSKDVADFLDNLGFHPTILPTHFLDKENWLKLYGYMLTDFPDVVCLYLVQQALGFIPITFKHLDLDQYYSLAQQRKTIIPEKVNDSDYIFERMFCGSTTIPSEGTIRWDISRPRLQALGFNSMTGFASAFDPFHYYSNRSASYPLRAFNGVHIPNCHNECACDIEIFEI